VQSGYNIPNISASVHAAEIILIICGLSKGMQYISKGGRVLPIVFGNNKNEGHKGKAVQAGGCKRLSMRVRTIKE
jgi:hypothetical protein